MEQPRSSNASLFGAGATVIGILLTIGGLMFLLVLQLIPNAPQLLTVPPLVQIGLGITGSIAGLMLRRGSAVAKFILAFAAFGVVANIVFLVIVAATLFPK